MHQLFRLVPREERTSNHTVISAKTSQTEKNKIKRKRRRNRRKRRKEKKRPKNCLTTEGKQRFQKNEEQKNI